MGSRMASVRLTVLGLVMIVTILALTPVASIAQEAQPATPPNTPNTPPDPTTQEKEEEKVAPERLLFIAYEAFGKRFLGPMGIFYDGRTDEIFVADTGNHRVVILDGVDGFPKAVFDHKVKRGRGRKASLGEPRSIAVDSSGDIFIVDNLCNYVNVCNFRGDHLTEIRLGDYIYDTWSGTSSESMELGPKPIAVAVDSEDNIYVATSCWIFVFNQEFELQKQFGGRGKKRGEFTAIMDIWVDIEGKMYIVDAMGFGLQVMSPDGEVLLAFGEHGAGFNNFSMPTGIISDRRGYIWVVDTLRHIVPIFDADGKFLDYIGAYGGRPGQFAYPSAISSNRDGRIVVLEKLNARVQCFELAPQPKEGDDEPADAPSEQTLFSGS